MVLDWNLEEVKDLLEQLSSDLEVTESIVILEETLGVKSFSDELLLESLLHVLHIHAVLVVWLGLAVE